MSTGNNLQNSLKRAFDDYEVPLKDAQWKRLEGEIGGGGKKWKFFPYYFSGVLLIAIVSGIMSYYFIFEKNEFSNNKNLSNYKKYKFDSELNNYSKNLSKQQNEGNANLSETLKSSDNLKNNSITKSNTIIL